jgi:hypothetical protein
MRALITIAFATAMLVFAVWSREPGNSPSRFFKTMDRNHDAEVTYAEWRAELQAKSDWLQREWDFHSMDCNGDERLRWSEYRRVIYKGGTRCGKNPDIATRPRSADSFSYCDTDGKIGAQHCVLWGGDAVLGPADGPMQPLKIPE